MEIKNLPYVFIGKGEVKGFTFSLIHQSNKAYIYAVDTGCSTHYEVFKKKTKTNSIRYCCPTSKAFGLWAWSYQSLERATNKFNRLNKFKND